MSDVRLTSAELDFILSPASIRDRAAKLFALTQEGKTRFTHHPEKLKPTVEYVLQTIRKNYPSLEIPFHSRWGHFRAGGIDRAKKFDGLLNGDALEKCRAKLDLVITSVLLDAGAGAAWKYDEPSSGKSFNRSEGLGVASLDMFVTGVMAGDRKSLRADGEGLRKVTTDDLIKAFQVSEKNPLLGVEGRVLLLNNLARAVENKKIFRDGRPGNIVDYVVGQYGKTIPGPGLLRAVLDGLGSIWPGRLSSGDVNLGDVWMHSLLGAKHSFAGLVPIHKLSQWMTYSLIEPIEEAGFTVSEVDGLTGLAEYRNGGLLIDSGLLSLKDPGDLGKNWAPDSELVIEWRALTVHLLDQIGAEVQKALGKNSKEFPLAKVLEGGTWWAGRFLAREKRPGGEPPLNIISDGTVF